MRKLAVTSLHVVVYGLIGLMLGGVLGWVMLPGLSHLPYIGALFLHLSATNVLVVATCMGCMGGLGSEWSWMLAKRGAVLDYDTYRRGVRATLIVVMLLGGGIAGYVGLMVRRDSLFSLTLLIVLLGFAFASGLLMPARAQELSPQGSASVGLGTISGAVFGGGLGLSYVLVFPPLCSSHTCRFAFAPLPGLLLGLFFGLISGLLMDLLVPSTLSIGRIINERLLPLR